MANKRPMARTLEHFREKNYTIDVVERWIGGYTRKDFLGCIDAIAFFPGKSEIFAIQVFGSDWGSHRKKIVDEQHPGALLWLNNKNTRFFFVGWRKLKYKRGSKAMRWKPRFGEVILNANGKLILRKLESMPKKP